MSESPSIMARQVVDEKDARKRVYDDITYRKALVNIYVDKMLLFLAMKKERIYLTEKHGFRFETSQRLRQRGSVEIRCQ